MKAIIETGNVDAVVIYHLANLWRVYLYDAESAVLFTQDYDGLELAYQAVKAAGWMPSIEVDG